MGNSLSLMVKNVAFWMIIQQNSKFIQQNKFVVIVTLR